MRQTFRNDKAFTHPMVSAGDPCWTDYEAEVLCHPMESGGRCGLVFRYETNRRYYFFGLVDGGVALIRVREEAVQHVPDEEVLGTADLAWEAGRAYRLRVRVVGDGLSCSAAPAQPAAAVQALVEAKDASFPRGKIALTSDVPADFLSVEVLGTEDALSSVRREHAAAEAKLEGLRAQNPRPVVWKKIATPGFGVGRNLRFGDLDGDGRMEILVPQVIQHGPRDAYAEVGCLTAVDLDGGILWRHGEPDPANWFLTNDVAVQVHDIDGDGAAEVLYCRDFELRIVEGATGRIKRSIRTPESCRENDKFPRILGDCLFFCDVRGLGRMGDIVLKDRYWNFWVYNQDLELLWKGSCKTGHYPYAADIDGDVRDEIAIGYSLYDHDGTLLWTHDEELYDHSDGVAFINLHGPEAAADRILYAASDEGVLFLDLKGDILKHYLVGHAQNPAVLKLRADLPGLQVVTINFWGNQGILHFFDADGNLYHRCEPNNFGSMCLPVNWRGDGVEFFLHSTNPALGGMFDGWGRPVVAFPEDGHPDLCNAVLDLTGDCRDEVVTWNEREIWIYTQEDGPRAGRLYRPRRNPQANSSNYQASLSLPGWSDDGRRIP